MTERTTHEVIDRGIHCLLEHLGPLETERFIAAIQREHFDYTTWRQQAFDGMSAEAFHAEALDYAREHPFPRHAVAGPKQEMKQ